MWPALLISVACISQAADNAAAVARDIGTQCQTGTLIFSKGDCLAVKVFSGSRFTHCAAVVIEDGQPIVYDSMNGVGVRRTELADYLQLQTPSEIQLLHPAQPWSGKDAAAFQTQLQSQLGRPYGIKHHVSGKRANGVHCAEYCTDALLAAGKVSVKNPPRVSPGSLFDGLTEYKLYAVGSQYTLEVEVAPIAANETWCQWAWRSTFVCTAGCCRQLSRWMLCREK